LLSKKDITITTDNLQDLIGLKIDLISYMEGCFATGIFILVGEWE
jgi:hypothetical protein